MIPELGPIIPRLRRLYRRLRYRLHQGFWPEEVWNLDVSLAEWLARRLKALAAETKTYPSGYGGWMSDELEWKAWTADLIRHARACDLYARRTFLAEGDEAMVLDIDYKEALQWVSENYNHLWT